MKKILSICLIVLVVSVLLTACQYLHVHQYGEWVVTKAATCDEKGTQTRTCPCGEKESVTISPTGHEEKIIEGKAATCTSPGLTDGKSCKNCGEILVEQEEIPALDHNIISDSAKAPTCTEDGLTEGKHCDRCDYKVAQEVIPALGHTAGDEADCLNAQICTVCKTQLSPAKGHTEVIDEAKTPTCTEIGLTEGKHCSNCGEILVAQTELNKIAHTYDDNYDESCNVCGFIRDAECAHIDLTILPAKDATCTDAGLTDGKKCSVCHKTLEEQVEIPATNHNYEGVVTTAPTCTEKGVKTFTCKNDPAHTYTEEIPTSGHSFGDDFVCDNCNLDTTDFRLENGGFENGLDGWTLVGNIGGISSDKNYWLGDPERAEGFEFGMDGEKMFSAYAPGAEERLVGTLTSSSFVVGGSGFVTFKVGAMRDENYVYVDVVDAQTKQILARYYNGLWADRTNDMKSGCTLIAYKADLREFMGKEVFFRISDNADSGYGLFFADSFVTYYDSEPDGFNPATPVSYAVSGTIYDLFNGSFEMGNVQGWWNIGEIGVVTNANGYWGDNIPYEKVGDYLFTGVESFGADTMREGNKGTLTSSVFEIGGTGWISFKLGGGGNELCYILVIDAVTGEILAKYHQQAQRDAILIQYTADLSAYIGRTARIQVVDQADSGWGCVSFDHVVTYYPEGVALPEGIVANNLHYVNYNVTNGSFENGLEGWTQNIWDAGAHNTLGWVESSEHNADWYTKNDDRKDGNNIFTFCKPDGTNCENTKGELVSSTFTLKQDSFVSFRFGGAGTRDVRVELVRADGTVIATFYNEAPGKVNTEMYAYFYQYTGETTECFFRVVDDSVSNYGCFVVDDFRANLESAPEGFIPAIQ